MKRFLLILGCFGFFQTLSFAEHLVPRNAGLLTTGTLPDARLSANVVIISSNNLLNRGTFTIVTPNFNNALNVSTSGILSISSTSLVRSFLSNTTLNIPDSVDTSLVFDSRIYDIQNEYNVTTGSFTPKEAGWYRVNTKVTWNVVNATVVASSFLYVDPIDAALELHDNSFTVCVPGQTCETTQNQVIYLKPGDTVAIHVNQAGAVSGTRALSGSDSPGTKTFMTIEKIR